MVIDKTISVRFRTESNDESLSPLSNDEILKKMFEFFIANLTGSSTATVECNVADTDTKQ